MTAIPGRGTAGRPVLSIWGPDIICYGPDLVDLVNQGATICEPGGNRNPRR